MFGIPNATRSDDDEVRRTVCRCPVERSETRVVGTYV
jgi:hypothetical protein